MDGEVNCQEYKDDTLSHYVDSCRAPNRVIVAFDETGRHTFEMHLSPADAIIFGESLAASGRRVHRMEAKS